MGTARQLTDLELQEMDFFDDDLEFTEELIFDDRLNALINRKLQVAHESLHSGGRLYSQEEVDEELEKIFLMAEQNVQN